MPARITRQEARQKMIDVFMSSLDKVIPADERIPLRGRTFLDWEQQAEQFKHAVLPTLLEERAALDDNALALAGGHCPYCGSDRIYLEKETSKSEARSPDGVVNYEEQHCRCRNCGGSFSPSAS